VPGEASRMLHDRYGVPVSGLECVPEWLTANTRPGGAPPDTESLTLDLARLDLSSADFESLQMTRELLAEPGAVRDILEADREIAAGEYHTLDELRAALEHRQRAEDAAT
jgi:hypothetical protein